VSARDDDSIRESFNKYDPDGSSLRPSSSRQRSGINYGSDDGEHQADPSAVIDTFRQLDAGKSDRYDDELPELPLPGTGPRRDTCGDEMPRFCGDCGKVSFVGQTCNRSRCPRCWKAWDRRRATTVTSKLEALRRYRERSGEGWQGWKFHHLVLSPPPGYAMDRDDPLQSTFDVLKEVLDEIGVDTGYLFYHPYRGPEDDDRGFWKNVLPSGEEIVADNPLQEAAVEDPAELGTAELVDAYDLQASPHFHAVVLSKYVDTEHVVGAVEEATGWTIHRITKGEDSDVSLYNDYDLARSVSYCLSHTGLGEDRVAYRPFGEVANFAAKDRIQREMDACVRSVAVNTLGLPYDSQACVVEREKVQMKEIERPAEKVNLGAAHGSGGEPETVVEEVEETVEEKCDGRLLEIKAAPSRLDDREWMETAAYAHQLQETWREWREKVDGLPDPDPFDAPG